MSALGKFIKLQATESEMGDQDSSMLSKLGAEASSEIPKKTSVLDNKFDVVTSEPKGGFTEKQGAFDYGLLIAFPIMIGTLGFFLFFPYIAPMLAANSQ